MQAAEGLASRRELVETDVRREKEEGGRAQLVAAGKRDRTRRGQEGSAGDDERPICSVDAVAVFHLIPLELKIDVSTTAGQRKAQRRRCDPQRITTNKEWTTRIVLVQRRRQNLQLTTNYLCNSRRCRSSACCPVP
jgi:hypothetical protein